MKTQLLTYDDVSQRLKVKKGTLYAWVSRGRIPFSRLGGRVVRFDADQLDRWVHSRTTAPNTMTTQASRSSEGGAE